MPDSTPNLIVGVGGHVVALNLATGDELWRTRLKGSGFVTVRETEDLVLAGANGELFCLDRASGDLLWHNKLDGLGRGIVAFTDDRSTVIAAAEAAARAAASNVAIDPTGGMAGAPGM